MQEQKQPTVALINDEEFYAMALSQYFMGKGLNVLVAHDAESAAVLMQGHEAKGGEVNVVVTDVSLPGKDGIRFAEDIRAGMVVKNPEKIYIIVDSGDPNLNIGPVENCAYDYVFPHGAVDKPMPLLADMVVAALAKGQSPASDDPKVIIYQPEQVGGDQRLLQLMAKDAGLVLIRAATTDALSSTLLREGDNVKLMIVRPEVAAPLEEIQKAVLSPLPPVLHVLSNAAALARQDEIRVPLVRDDDLVEVAPTEKELMKELMNAMLNAAAGRPLDEDFFARRDAFMTEVLANKDGKLDTLREGAKIAALGWLNKEEERQSKIVKSDGQEPG